MRAGYGRRQGREWEQVQEQKLESLGQACIHLGLHESPRASCDVMAEP